MQSFTLNKETPVATFKLTSENSYLLLKSVTLQPKATSIIDWKKIIEAIRLHVELRYSVYEDPNGKFIDDRTLEFPINLPVGINQMQPVFELNQRIENRTFTIGNNPEKKFYTSLKIELFGVDDIEEEFVLKFDIILQ
jgi:hypothetical protein